MAEANAGERKKQCKGCEHQGRNKGNSCTLYFGANAPCAWGDGDRRASPTEDKIVTIRLRNGDIYRLAGLHIMTKELRHWLWITLWWSDRPDEDFGADRPASFQALDPVWSQYKMGVVVDYLEGDPDPASRFLEHPTLAAALGADECQIYTDVDGVYTTDPRIVAKARKQKAVTYEEMLELASVGAKVLQTRSVGLAMKEGVRVQVLSSFVGEDAIPADDLPGTMIVSEEEMNELVEKGDMERQHVTGIAHDKNEAKVILTRVPDKPGAVAHIFEPLAAASINVDMIIQNVGRDKGETDVTFTIPQTDLARAQALLDRAALKERFRITTVKLKDVDVIGPQSPQTGLDVALDYLLFPDMVNLKMILVLGIRTATLGCEIELTAPGANVLADALFADPVIG